MYNYIKGLDVPDKATRVYNYHSKTVHAALELIGAIGIDSPEKLRPHHIMKRVSSTTVRRWFFSIIWFILL